MLLPYRNAQNWIVACVESVLNQSHPHWELIAIDDHSTDNSAELVHNLAKRDSRIVAVSNRGAGIIDALKSGLKKASCDWVSRMDADDLMPIDKLKNLLQALNGNQRAVATGLVRYFSEGKVSNGYLKYERWLNERCALSDHWTNLYRECVVASPNWLTHRTNVKFHDHVYPEDYRLVFHWYELGLEVKCSGSVTHLWREHPLRTSRNSTHYNQDSFFRLKVERFLALERVADKHLIIVGNNRKSKLLVKFLSERNMELHQIRSQSELEKAHLQGAQLLVAVYPNPKQRQLLEKFLEHKQLVKGRDWWWV
ncbi:MAG: hypothetical protein Kow0075_02570 [Salibacteraceae bacterium]